MPYTYRIDKARKLVLSCASGTFTVADLKAQHDALRADPDFSPEFDLLADFTQVTRFDISSAELAGMASSTVYSATSRLAAVSTNDEGYGLLRMYMAFREIRGGAEDQIRPFRNHDDALRWLKR